MPLKTFFLLASLGQARYISSRNEPPSIRAEVNGAITSFTVSEGSGCPAGTYKSQPITPGKTLNTYVDFDSWVFNSNTSTSPPTCTFSIDFEFTYPDDGVAELYISTTTYVEAKYEEGDENRETMFVLHHNLSARADAEEIAAPLDYILLRDGTAELNAGAGLLPNGTSGDVGKGNYRAELSTYTDSGPGEFAVYRIAIGFGLHPDESEQDSMLLRAVDKGAV